jgi:multicomponent Na+:H+ antiporter subunit A
MLLAVLGGYLATFITPIIHRLAPAFAGLIMAAVPAVIFGFLVSFTGEITAGQTLQWAYPWHTQLEVNLVFYLDGLSLFFALLISGFGTLIMVYAGSYLKGHKHLGRFLIYMLLFMGSMLGLVLSGNIISLFVFWELTSLSSFLLIGFYHDKAASRNSALQAMLVTVGGGFCLLVAFVLIGQVTGTFSLSNILNSREMVQNSAHFVPILVLLLLGAFTKSAQFPFYFWLPNAMAAPTPVSAYLHSATMVKAGIYLLARFNPVMGDHVLWQTTLMVVGGITLVMGAFTATQQIDLKRILAYTTISALGMLVMMLGIGTPMAIQGALVFILAHALYKGTLFLVAGNIDHQARTRDVNLLSGLGEVMPYTATASFLACASMAGVLPFINFIAKEMIYEAAIESPAYAVPLLGSAFLASVFFVAIALQLSVGVFMGSKDEVYKKTKEAYPGMLVAPLVFSGLGLVIGLMPQTLAQPLLSVAANNVLNRPEPLDLALWHGFNLILLLSLLTLVAGYGAYVFWDWLQKLPPSPNFLSRYGPMRLYEAGLRGIGQLAGASTRFFQHGRLPGYAATIVGVFSLTLIITLWARAIPFDFWGTVRAAGDYRLYEGVTLLLMPVALVVVLQTASRLTALAVMGVVGYSVALVFILFGAPDVAITQFLIETLTVVLFVLVLHRLPELYKFSRGMSRWVPALVALLFGGVITYVLLLVTGFPLDSHLKRYFAENSYTLGKGKNVVNVILVDFRALDTMGEITVLGIVAVGIFALLRLRGEEKGEQGR